MAQTEKPVREHVAVREYVAGGGEMQSRMAPSFGKSFDQEEDGEQHMKKSVLSRVREKAKKWKQTLTKKKQAHHEENTTPDWGVTLEEEEDYEDSEYHGPPMYETEAAPQVYKQPPPQPAATPLLHRNPLDAAIAKDLRAEGFQNSRSKTFTVTGTGDRRGPLETKSLAKSVSDMSSATRNKTLTKGVTELLRPCATVSDATQAIASKIQVGAKEEKEWDKGVSVKEYSMQKLEPGAEEKALSAKDLGAEDFRNSRSKTFTKTDTSDHGGLIETKSLTKSVSDTSNATNNKTLTKGVTELLGPACVAVSDATKAIASKIQVGAKGEQVWDKGVSVKEYVMQKLEPGAKEKALSEVISEAMTPIKAGANGEVGVVDKVKEAVSSLLGREELPTSAIPLELNAHAGREKSSASSIPVAMNAHTEITDEKQGR